MDKSRILAQMESFEKLVTGRSTFKTKDDEITQYRNATSKILNLLEGNDHMYRDIIIKNANQVDALISALQANIDSQVVFTIIKIINELVGKSNSQKRAQVLVHHGATKAVLQCIYQESKETTPCEEYLLLLHQVLYRIGLKDRKIGVRARLSQCLPVILNLLRVQVNLVPHNRSSTSFISINATVSKNILGLLNVVRLYCQNLINTSRLGRNGLIGLLLKIISYSGKNHVNILRISLETMNLSVRTKSNGARAVNQGAMAMLLQLFLDWNRIDSRDKQLGLRKCILNVVKNLINLRAGRKAFLEADGLHSFYGFCETCKFQNSVESLVILASLILRKCFPKNRLPLSHYYSTLRCPLPYSGSKERIRYLLEFRKGVTSPSAPRSTSPVEVFPGTPFLGCHGDTDTVAEQRQYLVGDISPDSVEFQQDFDNHEHIFTDPSKENNRFRAHNLFLSLDRKLSESKKKMSGQLHHQAYLERNSDKSIQPVSMTATAIAQDQEEQEPFIDKDEQEEQCMVERLLMNESGYQPPDDRPIDKLKLSYDRFLFEMEIFKNASRNRSSNSQVLEADKADGDNRKEKSPTTKTENCDSTHTKESFMQTYMKISSTVTKSLGRFSMIAYPDLWAQSYTFNTPEPLTESFIQSRNIIESCDKTSATNKRSLDNPMSKKQSSSDVMGSSAGRTSSSSSNIDCLVQNKILDDLRRIIDSEDIMEKVVYDLDEIVDASYTTYNVDCSTHSNSDELELDKLNPLNSSHLEFDSQFECGNLRKAIQIRQYEYDLILNPHVNTNRHTQWFYFRVSAMESGVSYRFNIINCEKPNSQFNFGMQPLLYSVKQSMKGEGFWKRCGSEIFYYKNHFARSAATCGGNTGKSYFTCTFMIEFPNGSDICYLAYHYPYTYTRLLTDIHIWTRMVKSSDKNDVIDADGDWKNKTYNHQIQFQTTSDDNMMFAVQELCSTLLKNPVPLITITNWPKGGDDPPANPKEYIFLSSRVHPGESNSSWVIKGCIDFLISNDPVACRLRDSYIFKIVPMLNPDGVINGCHRCSMAGHDLNRWWLDPCETLNPTIYNTKGLLMLLTKLGQAPLVYCDFHGHSRRKNVFMFGCSPLMSWITDDSNNPAYIDSKTEDISYYKLPNILDKIAEQFSLDCCNFSIDKAKESTARVVVWRQFGVKRSYTMESSYCSCDQGVFKHLHINVPMLEDMGARFAESLFQMNEISYQPVFRNVNFSPSNSGQATASFEFDCSQPPNLRQQQHKEKPATVCDFNADCAAGDGSIDNDEDDQDNEVDLSDNDQEDDIEAEFDKDNEYNDQHNALDSD